MGVEGAYHLSTLVPPVLYLHTKINTPSNPQLDDEHKKIQAEVQANEPNCLTYMVYKQTNDKGQVTFVIHEK